MNALRLNDLAAHEVRVDGRRVLFHIPTTSLFDLDDVSGDVMDLFREQEWVGEDDLRQRFEGRYTAEQVLEVVEEFLSLDIIHGDGPARPDFPKVKIQDFPLSTMVLNVTTGCNLGCSYCYKEDLNKPSEARRMEYETAVQSVDLLFREGHTRDRVNVVFFGGEPLSNLGLIKPVVEYAEAKGEREGKIVDFSLTTNATLLTPEIVEYLNDHRFGLAISIDGPKAFHDLRRLTVGGKGTYDTVVEKVKMLLARYDSRPIGARVTMTAGVTDVVAIHEHLKDELGFAEVGFAPVTSGDSEIFNLNAAELADVFAGLKKLGVKYLEAALEDRNNGFSNMHQLMTDLYEGTKKALPCGAGVGLLAVDHEGGLNLCHRFTGSDVPTYGNVATGIDKVNLGKFIEEAAEREGTGCATCRIRNLCAGGCYHEAYARYEDPQHPTYHYCDLMRDWVDFGIYVYTTLMERNPGYFERHVSPRSLKGGSYARPQTTSLMMGDA
jgi:uncharacterized protein